jgi:hypothetical protein
MGSAVTLTGLDTTAPAGQRTFGPVTTVGTVVIGETLAIPLVMGDNTVSVPVQAVGVIVAPPTISSISVTFRTNLNASDVGLPISALAPFYYNFPLTIPTSIILHASAAQASPLSLWFY